MNEDPILARMVHVFEEVLDEEGLVLAFDTTADDIEEWDSLHNVRIMIALEQEFGVRLKASEVADLESVGDLMSLIKQKMEE